MSKPAPTLPADSQAREAALDISRSVIVQAPAGSGKTELLIRRMLRLLTQVTRPEEILAITFTRKAAAEMQARILAALKSAQGEPPTEPHRQENWRLAQQALAQDRRFGWRLLENPNRLTICTIDSFNGRLVRRLPLSAGLAFNAALTDQSDQAYREAARELLNSLDDEVPWAEALAQLLLHLNNDFDRAERLCVEMLKIRDQWLPHLYLEQGDRLRQHLDRCLTELLDERLSEACEPLLKLPDALWSLSRFAVDQLHLAQISSPILQLESAPLPPPVDHAALPAWQALTQLLLGANGEWRKTVNKNQGFPAATEGRNPEEKSLLRERKAQMVKLLEQLASDETSRAALLEIRQLPKSGYSDTSWALLLTLIDLLKPLTALLKWVFQRRNEIDHGEVAAAALRALGSDEQPTDLALALDYQIRHLLIDEFQDTSSAQIALLKRLTSGWEATDGRTLFLVGDPMQSIYRFREADVSNFLAAFHGEFNGLPLSALKLSTNFRSTNKVVDWINDAVGSAFPQRESLAIGAVPYSPATAFDTTATAHCAVTITLTTGPRGRLLEARELVATLQQELQQQQDSTIAVLVRARAHLHPLIAELKSAGITFQAIEVEPLDRRMAIQDLRTLTAALLHPADRLAWFALLRSPMVGLTLADLSSIAAQPDANRPVIELLEQPALLTKLTPEGAKRCQRLLELMTPALRQNRRRSMRDWVEGCWLTLGGPATLRSKHGSEEAEAFFQLLEKIEAAGMLLDLEQLDAELSRLHAPSQGGARVQLLTIHKAKGLEFDVLLLPGLDQKPPPRKDKLLNWHVNRGQHEPRLLMAPIASGKAQENPVNDYLREIERKREEQEAIRLLYVATTRARSRLHLFARVKRNDAGELVPPDKRTFLAMLWPKILPDTQLVDDEIAIEEPATTPRWHRLPADFAAPQLADEGLLSRFRGQDFPYDPVQMLAGLKADESEERNARQRGQLLHRIIEEIARSGVDNWNEARIDLSRDGWRAMLRQLGYRAEPETALDRTSQTLRRCLQSSTFRWLLDPTHQQAADELEVSGWVDGELRHWVIDRTFIDEADVRWIVDYKSSRPADGEPLDHFLAKESEEYRQQLLDYRTLMAQLDSRPIRTALYFPEIDCLHEISQAPVGLGTNANTTVKQTQGKQ